MAQNAEDLRSGSRTRALSVRDCGSAGWQMRFMLKQALVAVLGAVVFAAAPARAGTIGPTILLQEAGAGVDISVNGQLFQTVPARITQGGQFLIPETKFLTQDFEVTVLALGDMEPFINYVVGAINFTPAPLAFGFMFFSPYVGGPYNTLSTSHSSSVTDSGANPNDLVTVAPTDPSGFVHVPHLDGLGVPGANIGIGCAVNPPGGGGGSDTCHPFSAISVPVGPTGPAGFFDVFVGIELSPNDLYSGNGRVDLTNVVPEPLSLGLLGLGLGAVVFFRRRRA